MTQSFRVPPGTASCLNKVNMKKAGRNVKKIVAAVSVTFFQLVACGAAILAWFIAYQSGDVGGNDFQVTNKNCDIDSVKLYKFIYDYDNVMGYRYDAPEDGGVECYDYNAEEEAFGYTDGSGFHAVSVMNVYDPIELLIGDDSTLRKLNCGVVYEVTLRSTDYATTEFLLKSLLISKSKTASQIYLSDCVDFDVYYQSDIDGITTDVYYPSFEFDTTSPEDVLYHKLAYLSDEESSHSHFYGNPKQNEITLVNNDTITFEDNYFKVYIFANYATSQLSSYYSNENLNDGILAVYDFSFSFTVGGDE